MCFWFLFWWGKRIEVGGWYPEENFLLTGPSKSVKNTNLFQATVSIARNTIFTVLGQSAFSNPLLLDSGLFHNEVQYAFCIVGHTHSNCCDNLTPLEGKSICRLSLKILCQNSVLTPRSQANLFAQPNCRIQ